MPDDMPPIEPPDDMLLISPEEFQKEHERMWGKDLEEEPYICFREGSEEEDLPLSYDDMERLGQIEPK